MMLHHENQNRKTTRGTTQGPSNRHATSTRRDSESSSLDSVGLYDENPTREGEISDFEEEEEAEIDSDSLGSAEGEDCWKSVEEKNAGCGCKWFLLFLGILLLMVGAVAVFYFSLQLTHIYHRFFL